MLRPLRLPVQWPDDVVAGGRLGDHGWLQQPVDKQAARGRSAAVEAEHGLVQIGVQMCRSDRAVARSQDPTFDKRTVMPGLDVPAPVSMAGVHRVASVGKQRVLATHRGSLHPVHVDVYPDEPVFRCHRRMPRSRSLLVHRPFQPAVITAPVTCENVVTPLPKPAPGK